MDEMILEFRQAEVNLNGRKFLLREMPAKQLREYKKLVELVLNTDSNIPSEERDKKICEQVGKILHGCKDQSKFVTDKEFLEFLEENLTSRFLVKIIEIQNRLNSVAENEDDKKK